MADVAFTARLPQHQSIMLFLEVEVAITPGITWSAHVIAATT
jgi:hypothetical protein